MRIRRVDVDNFRGIQAASWRLPPGQRFFALIGPGDSTKTTVLTAIERALHDRVGHGVVDTDFFNVDVSQPIRIRVAVDELPDELLAMDAFGGFLAGIDADGEWTHDPSEESERCVIIEYRVENDLEPVWQSYRPPLEGLDDEEPQPIRAKHRARMTAYRIDDRIDAHLRWSRTSSLGKLTADRDATRSTLTEAGRAARMAAAGAVPDSLKTLADDVKEHVQAIGTTEFVDLKPGLDLSLANTQGNLALFEGDVPLMNFGLGTRRLTGAATQQLANQGGATLLVDEVEHGLEPHRLVHLLHHLRTSEAFSQVFVTTHSPTALQHLEPEELIMVRSNAGETTLRPLDSPADLRALLKSVPAAFLARRIIVNEGKTELGMTLELSDVWNRDESVPSAALGVHAVEGGGTASPARARQLQQAGYQVVLFIDSDNEAINKQIPELKDLGVAVVQWGDGHCIETAVCAELDEAGLTKFIQAALQVADDQEGASQSYAGKMVSLGASGTRLGADPLNVATWAGAGVDLEQARTIVGTAAKSQSWFKRVDLGRRLGRFVLETPELQRGAVRATLDMLRAAIYARPRPASERVLTPPPWEVPQASMERVGA